MTGRALRKFVSLDVSLEDFFNLAGFKSTYTYIVNTTLVVPFFVGIELNKYHQVDCHIRQLGLYNFFGIQNLSLIKFFISAVLVEDYVDSFFFENIKLH